MTAPLYETSNRAGQREDFCFPNTICLPIMKMYLRDHQRPEGPTHKTSADTMRRKSLEFGSFFLWLAVGQTVVLYGRYCFQLAGGGNQANPAPRLLATGILAISCAVYALIRTATLGMRSKVLIGLFVGASASVAIQVSSDKFSALACAVHFYLFFTGLVAVSLYDFLGRSMLKEFWNLLFDYMTKMIQYFLVLLVGGAAVLRYIYPEDRQHDFRADLFCCGAAVIFSFMFILYWVMVPAWIRLAEGYSASDQSSQEGGKEKANPSGHSG
jgi:hypothetical protein